MSVFSNAKRSFALASALAVAPGVVGQQLDAQVNVGIGVGVGVGPVVGYPYPYQYPYSNPCLREEFAPDGTDLGVFNVCARPYGYVGIDPYLGFGYRGWYGGRPYERGYGERRYENGGHPGGYPPVHGGPVHPVGPAPRVNEYHGAPPANGGFHGGGGGGFHGGGGPAPGGGFHGGGGGHR